MALTRMAAPATLHGQARHVLQKLTLAQRKKMIATGSRLNAFTSAYQRTSAFATRVTKQATKERNAARLQSVLRRRA